MDKYRNNRNASRGKATNRGLISKAIVTMMILVLAMALTLTSCGNGGVSDTAEASTTVSAQAEAADKTEMFTDRDLSGDYDESKAVKIKLNGSSAEASSQNGVSISGGIITITEEGTYIVSGKLDDGQIVVEADDNAKVQVVLKDASITSKTSAALYVKSADKVFVTTAEGSENSLSNGGSFTADGDTNVDGAIFAKDDITLNGSGSMTVTSPVGHGIVGKDDVKIAGGTVKISAAKHGVQANDSVRIAEASVTVIAEEKDGIHVSDDADAEEGTTSDSYFYMADGSLAVSAGDDGIHADAEVRIEGGTIDVAKSYEGIEGLNIKVSGGDIKVAASDDGINAAGGSSQRSNDSTFGDDDWAGGKHGGFSDGGTDGSIEISGGSIYIKAGGDGIDSNGSVTVSGGCTVVCGPTQGDTSVLDFNSAASITGGSFAGTGGAGMAANFTDAQQGLIAVSTGNQSAGQTVTLKDSDGKTIMEVTPELDYSVVYISTEDMAKGSTYTLTAGSYSESITLSDNIYSTLTGGHQGGMRGGMSGNNGNQDGMNGDGSGENDHHGGMHGGMRGGKPGRPPQDGSGRGPGSSGNNDAGTDSDTGATQA